MNTINITATTARRCAVTVANHLTRFAINAALLIVYLVMLILQCAYYPFHLLARCIEDAIRRHPQWYLN